MMADRDIQKLLRLYAEVLDYPTDSLSVSVSECAGRLAEVCSDAATDMRAFQSFAGTQTPGAMEEIYTRTFDVTPTTTLYAGYHLFGETYKRGTLLVRLQEAYKEHGFSFGPDLADHLSILLRFASVADDPEFVNPLLGECILPALDKLEEAFRGSSNGYGAAVTSLRSYLRQECRGTVAAGGMHHEQR